MHTTTETITDRCCGTSVGALITDSDGRLLMIERGWYPLGIAPVAGHVADEHPDPTAALAAEVAEEVGLTVTAHHTVWQGWLPNLCAAPPALPIPGHHWTLATATTTGVLHPDPTETRGAAWYRPDQVRALATRTLDHARGHISPTAWQHAPGLEPVWLELLTHAGLLHLDDDELALAERLYTTPPREYWTGGRLVPAHQLATNTTTA